MAILSLVAVQITIVTVRMKLLAAVLPAIGFMLMIARVLHKFVRTGESYTIAMARYPDDQTERLLRLYGLVLIGMALLIPFALRD